jgi:hypothetical protein
MDAEDIFDAFRAAQGRGILPTDLSSKELRDLAAGVRANAVFTARGTSAAYATKLKEVINAIAQGKMGENQAITALFETLQALKYSPEGGFPDAPAGAVPPALRGTLQDLSSLRRLRLIVKTQTDLMRGAGQQLRGLEPEALAVFPCWELVRVISVRVPRDWDHPKTGRWKEVGGQIYQGRMIAPKGDVVWGELGSAFPDSLDVDYPPFAFNSGMGWKEIDAATADELEVTSSDGLPWREFIDQVERPQVMQGKLPLPSPQISPRGIDPAYAQAVTGKTAVPDEAADATADFNYEAFLLAELQKADIAYGVTPRTSL